ncbi:MAG TPA: hypothetical protein VNC39_01530 [Acidocella sp.]|jgi:hypothetical protein|uniref:hypothetical protein n=1 Tax=Acidocella sp. TaxID=50710 RepID=UPI002CBA45A7|nr:hypothetical protein [Acidocella sp.]HVE20631.1 hypothetical protein [Acidocella sp.]
MNEMSLCLERAVARETEERIEHSKWGLLVILSIALVTWAPVIILAIILVRL